MAHCFLVPPDLPAGLFSINKAPGKQSTPMPQPPQSLAEMTAEEIFGPSSNRNDSVSSSTGSSPTSAAGVNHDQTARRDSATTAHRHPSVSHVRTRSIPGVIGSTGVVLERGDTSPNDDEVIMVTVRLTNRFRKSSVGGSEDLPSRPPRRSFLRRLSTRVGSSWDHSAEKEERYKAIKMPRGEYKRHFRRDKDGGYAGTEPERQWDEEELIREYAAYQEVPLHGVTC